MRLLGSTNLTADLAKRLDEVAGISTIEPNDSESGTSFELFAQIGSRGSFSHGPGYVSERYLVNPEVETDVLRVLDEAGFDAHISRPIEVRNDGSFAVRTTRRVGPSL